MILGNIAFMFYFGCELFLPLCLFPEASASFTYSIYPKAALIWSDCSLGWLFFDLISFRSTFCPEFCSRLNFLNSFSLCSFSACICLWKFWFSSFAISFISSICWFETCFICCSTRSLAGAAAEGSSGAFAKVALDLAWLLAV